jgi:hypothetical protein
MNRLYRYSILLLTGMLLFAACSPTGQASPEPARVKPATPRPTLTETSALAAQTPTGQAETTPTLPAQTGLDPQDWMNWPITPVITQNVADIYARGQALGNNPRAFSVFGDCQSQPEVFMSVYEKDAGKLAALPPGLQETVAYFEGSFTHQGPTTKDSSTAGAMLWPGWHEDKYTCQTTETPMDCELRLNNPSFVFITVGTHYEVRNEMYMRRIIEHLLEKGVVPILATKADNREQDHSINLLMAQLATEYNIPLWNFWAATQDIPGQGLVVKAPNEHLGAIYFDENASERFRFTALQALDAVRRAVIQK